MYFSAVSLMIVIVVYFLKIESLVSCTGLKPKEQPLELLKIDRIKLLFCPNLICFGDQGVGRADVRMHLALTLSPPSPDR